MAEPAEQSKTEAGNARSSYEKARDRVWIVLAVLFVLSILAIFFGANGTAPDEDNNLWFELLKGGVTLLLATVVGGSVGLLVNQYKTTLDERADREIQQQAARRRLTDLRLRVLRDTVQAYNDVKAVRRRLRALGLYEPQTALDAWQVERLRREMDLLLEAQLTFEALREEIEDTNAFTPCTEEFTEGSQRSSSISIHHQV